MWASLFFYLMSSCFCYLWVYFYLKSEDIHEERYMWWLSWKEKVKKHGYVNSVEIYICQKYERRRMGLLSCEYTRQKPKICLIAIPCGEMVNTQGRGRSLALGKYRNSQVKKLKESSGILLEAKWLFRYTAKNQISKAFKKTSMVGKVGNGN